MKLRDHYDWIVLGSHPGALYSASLAAKLGLSVLIVPYGLPSPSRRTEAGLLFDPEPNFLMGVSDDGLTPGWVLQGLGFSDLPPEFLTYTRTQSRVLPQVLTPQARLVLETQESLPFELQRELGSTAAHQLGLISALKMSEQDLLSFWSHLPSQLFPQAPTPAGAKPHAYSFSRDLRETRKKLILKDKLKSKSQSQVESRSQTKSRSTHQFWFAERETVGSLLERIGVGSFQEIASGLYSGLASSAQTDPLLFDLLILFHLSRTGAAFQGGLTAFRGFLIKRAIELGAHFNPESSCKRIFIENQHFKGVQMGGSGNMISGATGILGCPVSRVDPNLIQNSKPWYYFGQKKRDNSANPSGWRFTLALGVHQEAIPEKLQNRAFWQEKGAPLLEIEVAEPNSHENAQPGERVIFLRTLLPYEVESLDPDYQRRIAGRMFRKATELMPFLEYHVTQIYPDFRASSPAVRALLRTQAETGRTEGRPDGDEITRVYGFSSLDEIPDPLLCYSGQGIGPTTGVEKLYAASHESYPFLGDLGGIVAALQALSEATGRTR